MPPTPGNKRYLFVLIDDYSWYMWTVLLKQKSEAFEIFKTFKNLAGQETRTLVKTLRTDRGGEFMSQEFKLFCVKDGINRHLTARYSPQQNGVVERHNRTLLEMTRSILKHMTVPNLLWGEAVRHSTYLINKIATRSLVEKTPYEALRSRKLNLRHIKVFGCVCYRRTEAAGRNKLETDREHWCTWVRSRVLRHIAFLILQV